MIKLIPNKLKIGGLRFIVLEDDRLIRNEKRYGETRFIHSEIAIASDIPEDHKEETLLHEILEVITGLHEIEIEHKDICTLSSCLYQVFKDNGIKFGDYNGQK